MPAAEAEIKSLVENNLPLVRWAINRYTLPNLSQRRLAEIGGYDELVAIGNAALFHAARHFDPAHVSPRTGRPVAFTTFATRVIWQELWRVCSANQRLGTSGVDVEAMPDKHDAHQVHDNREHIATLLRRLPRRHADIIRARFFLDMKLADIGAELGITRERVRQIEADALEMLAAGT